MSILTACKPAVLLLLLACTSPLPNPEPHRESDWELQGNLAEACSCSPPCSCNFGVGSSPHNYCWFIFSLRINDGHFGAVNLEGMRLAAGIAAKGIVWYIDSNASQDQADALKKIASHITESVYKADGIKPTELPVKGFKTARIEQYTDAGGCKMTIGDSGGFESKYIVGLDGKTPVVVENNWSWNMKHGMKAKTSFLKYHDDAGNRIDLKGTNASYGEFDWADTTPIYFR